MRPHRLVLALLTLALSFRAAGAVTLHPGDLVVTGGNASGGFVAVVDPATGTSQIISQGGLLTSPSAVTVAANGSIYVGNQTSIVRVEPVSGAQSTFVSLTTVSVRMVPVNTMISHRDGKLYYTSQTGNVVRLDPNTGGPTPITSGLSAAAVTEGPDGFLYVSACLAADGVSACLGLPTDIVARRVDPATGTFTTAGFGPIGKPRDIAFDSRDSMYVESSNDRRLFRFSPVTMASGALPLFGNELSYSIQHMVGHPDGNLYLTHNYTEGRIDRIDPSTNSRSSAATFPSGTSLVAITVVRDWTTRAQHTTWGQLKQHYR